MKICKSSIENINFTNTIVAQFMKTITETPDEQVALLVSLLANSTDFILQLDANGIIVYINRVPLGLRHEEVLGTHWLTYVPVEHRKMLEEYFQKTLKTGETIECEALGPGDNGTSNWYWKRYYPLRKGDEIQGVICVSRDITDRRKIQVQLEHQQTHLLNFFNRAPVLICMFSGKDFIFQMVNQEYQKLLGNRNVIGKSFREVVPLFDEAIFSTLETVFRTNQSFVGRDVLVTADWGGGNQPDQRYFSFLFEPVANSEDKVESVWVLGMDVTESKRLESSIQLNDRLMSLGTLVAGIGHEINNPLAYSILNLDIIQSELMELFEEHEAEKIELINQKIEIAHRGLQRVAGIVKGLKAFSRSAELAEVTKIELNECIDGAIEIGASIINHRGRVEKDYETPLFIKGNATKVIQVFLNLLVNAAHALDEANFSTNLISIQTRSHQDGVQIMITDTGAGISPENLKKIFDPFFTTKEVGVGSGLGLPICHGIVSTMGGSISFESKIGFGTKVILTFPHWSNS